MFTGIVKGIGKIVALDKIDSLLKYAVEFPEELLQGLEKGASVSVDGVCQTVVEQASSKVWFDAIGETISRTTFKKMGIGSLVNLERSARIGDEIGGHLLSGHIYGTATLSSISDNVYQFSCPKGWMNYFFSKGFVAIDGISLTLVDVDKARGHFTVHLIPETLKRTTLGQKRIGDGVNIEIDALTQAAVETVLNSHSALYNF